jgi:hypothetical protein
MMEFSFNLNYQLSVDDANHDELVERLGQAGCDDAVVGIGQPGRIALEFIRDAENALSALTSAIVDVRRAIPFARLIEVGPDLVGLTDIAEVAGVSRQNMRKLAVAHFGTFPLPVHEGSSALWHLSDVLGWMADRSSSYQFEPGLLEVALMTKQLNLANQVQQLDPEVFCQVRYLFA